MVSMELRLELGQVRLMLLVIEVIFPLYVLYEMLHASQHRFRLHALGILQQHAADVL